MRPTARPRRSTKRANRTVASAVGTYFGAPGPGPRYNRPMNAQRYRRPLSVASALLGLMLGSVSVAQAPTNTPSPGPQLYRVEIIVFAHRQGNPAEEDFAYIARREAMSSTPAADPIRVFDFGPYLPDESSDDPDAERDPRSRLLLGQGVLRSSERSERPDSTNGSSDPTAIPPGAGDTSDPAVPDAGEADASIAADVGADETDAIADPFGGPGNAAAPFRFRLLDDNELELVDVRRRLERSYTPLVHGGWIQEGLPAQQARPFDLAYLGASTPSGTVRLHVSRFLHLTLDLDFRPDVIRAAGPAGAAAASDGAAQPANAFARAMLSELDVSRRYHLNAERRVRSGEVHHFDHPFFGVIAVVRPYEPPEPQGSRGVRPAA